jgi:glycosyltransferase involved in cell wall biosynthesis
MVLPSRWENFPLACMESMLSGRAVIASRAGGMAEMIEDGTSGLLIPPDAPEAITRAVLQLVKNPHAVGRLGAAGRERVLQWLAPDRIAPLQLAGYARAIKRCQRM